MARTSPAYDLRTGRRKSWLAAQQAEKAEKAQAFLKAEIAALDRQQIALAARDHLMTFIRFTSPDPAAPHDLSRSTYKNARHHDAIARHLEQVERGEITFLILVTAPRHGKSELVSRRLPAWYAGRHPDHDVVVATYNDDFAADFGADVRAIMTSPAYRQVFPDFKLSRGGAAKDRLQTLKGGLLSFRWPRRFPNRPRRASPGHRRHHQG